MNGLWCCSQGCSKPLLTLSPSPRSHNAPSATPSNTRRLHNSPAVLQSRKRTSSYTQSLPCSQRNMLGVKSLLEICSQQRPEQTLAVPALESMGCSALHSWGKTLLCLFHTSSTSKRLCFHSLAANDNLSLHFRKTNSSQIGSRNCVYQKGAL